jgi:arylsulfatase A-like enzyme
LAVPCSTLDYLPTLCELIGREPPQDRPLDGESLLPLLLGKTATRSSSIPFATNLKGPHAALIQGPFKLWTALNSANAAALYHLYDDPAEAANLIAEHPQLAQSMQAELRGWLASCRRSFEGEDYDEPYEPQGSFLKSNTVK